ncbi:MAG TPA: TonB-dependent receptor [Gallionellaceae bacterium]
MKQKLIAAALFGAAFLPYSAYADDTMEISIVTPTRLSQSPAKTLADTTVISKEEIRKSQAPDVPTLLSTVVGVEVSQPGGAGKGASLYLRGTNSTQVLVLVDGVRMSSATSGTTAVDQIMLDQVDHIEVVRGNVSALYGSEAIGGVIQIFTKRGSGATAVNASAGVGSLGTRRFSAGVAGSENGTDVSVQASTFTTKGVSALNPALVPAANPDRDGYRNNSLSANVGHAFNADHRISASLFGSYGNNQYDSAFGLPTDVNANKEQMWKLSLASDDQINDMWHSKLQVANGVDQYRDYLNGQPTAFFGQPSSLYQTASNQLSWQNSLRLDENKQFLLGAETLRQKVSSDINPGFAVNTRQINSVFGGYTGHYDAHQVQLNLRHDANSQFGGATTGLAGYGYAFNDAWRASASYSTAFRAPTFDDLYYPPTGIASNPGLQPERSRNLEAGVHYARGGQQVDAVYFENRIRDLIVLNAAFFPVNLNQARINGLELSYAGRFGDTGVKAGVTAQNPRDAATGVQLDRRARMHGSFAVTQQLGAWQVGAEWLHSSARHDASSTRTLAAYNVFALSAAYAISKEWKLQVRGDNLTNQNDTSAYGYNPLGRRVFANINYQQ